MTRDPIADIHEALAVLGMGPLDIARAEEGEDSMVTLFNGNEVAIGWIPREDYDRLQETRARRARERVVYRGPFGALRPVPR